MEGDYKKSGWSLPKHFNQEGVVLVTVLSIIFIITLLVLSAFEPANIGVHNLAGAR